MTTTDNSASFYSEEVKNTLLEFREASTHTSAICREAIQTLLTSSSEGTKVTGLEVYRVCDPQDKCLQGNFDLQSQFASACSTQAGAKVLLQRPPNPLADRIVRIVVTGKVFFMPYGNDKASAKKKHKEEVIFLLKDIQSASRMY